MPLKSCQELRIVFFWKTQRTCSQHKLSLSYIQTKNIYTHIVLKIVLKDPFLKITSSKLKKYITFMFFFYSSIFSLSTVCYHSANPVSLSCSGGGSKYFLDTCGFVCLTVCVCVCVCVCS
ncbi:hypothetical protein ILYODFUR_019067 [Ilyodon furcidens]|uniref:Uncharacterized protein n=1 Tax=Ilyodon furcidens TaxID=33524 RepID=A0ABV0TVU7_9TELE